MASMIEIRCISDDDPLEFKVVVRDGKGESRHHVTMADTYEQLTAGKYRPERCLWQGVYVIEHRAEPHERSIAAPLATLSALRRSTWNRFS
jgi:hypothetical protein